MLLPPGVSNAPTATTPSPAEQRQERLVVVVAVIIGVMIVAASLLRHDGDIAGLIKFGGAPDAQLITDHVEAELGRSIATVEAQGHDGKYFFLQALDPFFLDGEHAAHLDRPVYRAQRMLFPTIAGGFGLMPAETVLWTMGLVNIVAISLGTLGTARLARRLGGSTWLGLAFALNPGIVFEFDISGATILAFACAVWGTVAVMDQRRRAAVLWFCAAVLAREVMLLYLAGVCCHQLWTTRRIPFVLGAVPAMTAAAWAGYIRLRLDSHDGVPEVQEFGMPFAGMIDAAPNWLTDPTQLAVISSLAITAPLLTVRAVQRPNPLAWGALGFVVLAVLMTRQVWWNFFDISRAIAPAMTAYVVTTFSTPDPARRQRRRGSESSNRPSRLNVPSALNSCS